MSHLKWKRLRFEFPRLIIILCGIVSPPSCNVNNGNQAQDNFAYIPQQYGKDQ